MSQSQWIPESDNDDIESNSLDELSSSKGPYSTRDRMARINKITKALLSKAGDKDKTSRLAKAREWLLGTKEQASRLVEIGRAVNVICRYRFKRNYLPDSYDPITHKFHDKETGYFNGRWKVIDTYLDNPITLFTTFVGLPNQCDANGNLDWNRVWNNFIGWQDNKTPSRIQINRLGYLYAPLKNSLFVIPTILKNILKVFTEWLPGVISDILCMLAVEGFEFSEDKLKEIWEEPIGFNEYDDCDAIVEQNQKKSKINFSEYFFKGLKSIPYAILYVVSHLLNALSYIFELAFYIGRTFSSPGDSARAALNSRVWLDSTLSNWSFFKNHPTLRETLSYIGVGALFLSSIISTTILWSLLLLMPFIAAPALGINLVPFATWFASITPESSTFLTYVGALFAMNIPAIITELGMLFSPAMIGLIAVIAGSIGLGISLVAFPYQEIAEYCREWWRTSENVIFTCDDTPPDEETFLSGLFKKLGISSHIKQNDNDEILEQDKNPNPSRSIGQATVALTMQKTTLTISTWGDSAHRPG